jgi:acyl-CoA hydrolase
MNIEERIRNFETRQFRMIFHCTVNDHDTLFGGTAMQWMDEVAYITATRFTRMKMVTISCEKVEFIQAIKYGSIVEIVGKVQKVGSVRIVIKVEIFIENLDNDNREKAVDAIFIFAAIDDKHNPVRIDLNENLYQ